ELKADLLPAVRDAEIHRGRQITVLGQQSGRILGERVDRPLVRWRDQGHVIGDLKRGLRAGAAVAGGGAGGGAAGHGSVILSVRSALEELRTGSPSPLATSNTGTDQHRDQAARDCAAG